MSELSCGTWDSIHWPKNMASKSYLFSKNETLDLSLYHK